MNKKNYPYEIKSSTRSISIIHLFWLLVDYFDDSIVGLFLHNIRFRHYTYKHRNDIHFQQVDLSRKRP